MPKVGDIIDNTFRIEKKLGEGAAGTAYKATLTRDWNGLRRGDLACLKWHKDGVFRKESAGTVFARRARETLSCAALIHPNVVRVYDTSEFWSDGKPRYALMELVRGMTLEKLAKKHPIPTDKVRSVIHSVALGLKAIHDHGVLHRDVKAANVMLDETGRVILMDLGVVRPETEATMTDAQAFLGTLRFAAPEWLFAEACTSASDVYSLGTVAYQLLTGQEIFADLTNFARLAEAVRRHAPPLPMVEWELRRRYLGNAVLRMLEKEAVKRPTLNEVIDILENDRRMDVWMGLHDAAIIQRMPEHYRKDGDSQRAFVESVLSHVPEREFREIVERKDYDRLMQFKEIRRAFNLMTIAEGLEDYLELPPELRVEWAKNILVAIDRDESMSWGAQIEQRCYLMQRVFKAEPAEEIRAALRPLLDQVEADMEQMMQDIAQENP